MQLDRIEIQGFKSIRSLELFLRPLNILIGANGSGKSNLISLFTLLNQAVEGNFQLFVRRNGGADAFLHYGQKHTEKITLHLTFGANAYSCAWVPTVEDSLLFESESIYYQGSGHSRPWNQLLGMGHLESVLPEEARKKPGKVGSHVLDSLRGWKVYHFHDTSASAPVKKTGAITDNIYLRQDAGNLAAFLYRLRQTAPGNYSAIRDAVRMVAPFFDDFILRPTPENEHNIRLEWRERGSDYPFQAYQLSDGTLRFMCLATLLLQPDLPAIVLVDEPELGLHPYAISLLTSLMRSTSHETQLIVSTQSVSLLNEFQPEDVLVVDRQQGETVIHRLDESRLADWLEEYSLGELWEKNVLGGRPAR